MGRKGIFVLAAGAACAALIVLLSAGAGPAGPRTASAQAPPVRTVLKGVEAMRELMRRERYADVEKFGYIEFWNQIASPEAVYLLAGAVERQHRNEEAAVWCTLLLRILRDAPKADVDRWQRRAELRLKDLDRDNDKRKADYAASAAGRKFTSPEQVDDLWMVNVEADLFPLHGLYAWKLVGGRTKGVKPDWIHNTQGEMHRSGLKLCQEVDGRKGVLFGVPIKAQADPETEKSHAAALARLGGHPTQIRTTNVGGCRFLRVGTRAYGFPYILKVRVGGKEIFARRIETQPWTDLKIDLAAPPAAGEPAGPPAESAPAPPASQPAADPKQVIVELVVPAGQRWSEGVWIDYLDFFED